METFVVRIWAPADPQELPMTTGRLQGRLEHATSDRGGSFKGIDELGSLILEGLRSASTGQQEAGHLPSPSERGAGPSGEGED
jgi:hypothetical protein